MIEPNGHSLESKEKYVEIDNDNNINKKTSVLKDHKGGLLSGNKLYTKPSKAQFLSMRN
ncbi:hypothetical protein J1TS3_31210 [Siminovitchia fordii]|uniref:Uncharacterized protein n=1 Tax=Siminovitchia fordii TaxID=254759 RepID=A0ABQ4K8C8_9BACI|nr:hypothetical protein J1TS3_31210 [Siminovitchia fordii]